MLSFRNQLETEVSVLELHELEVQAPRPEFDVEVREAEESVRKGLAAGTGPARLLYRRFGVDPTRHRPSSEALLRRVRRGEGLPRINSLVDVANLMSLRLQVPVGLYDLDRVEGGELTLRLGAAGESYAGIGKEQVSVAGRLCVADAGGPCGNPSADSARTMITVATQRAAWIYFLAVEEGALSATAELIARFGRGLMRVP
ncbi:MAG: B3/B4 domain-containing protein [Candidatus Dormibacteraceae bacterium]